MQNNKIK